MNFNPEITFGNVLTIASFLAAVVSAFYGLRGKLDVFVVMMEHNNDRFIRMEQRHELRLSKLEDNDQKLQENHVRLTNIVQEIIGQNSVRERWDDNRRQQEQQRNRGRNSQ